MGKKYHECRRNFRVWQLLEINGRFSNGIFSRDRLEDYKHYNTDSSQLMSRISIVRHCGLKLDPISHFYDGH